MGGYNFYPNRHSGGYHCHGSGATRKCYYPREVAWEWASTPFVNAQNCGPGCITSSDIPLDVAGERQEGLGMVGITDRVKNVVEEWACRSRELAGRQEGGGSSGSFASSDCWPNTT